MKTLTAILLLTLAVVQHANAQPSQTITLKPNPYNPTYGQVWPTKPMATSGLPVTVITLTPSVCTVGYLDRVTFVGVGTCTIQADQSGGGGWDPAPTVTRTFNVAMAPQTLAWVSVPSGGTYQGPPFVGLAATATSGLPVTFTTSTPSTVSISGNTAYFIGAGTGTIVANQSGNTNWLAAPSVSQSFYISKANQSISLSAPPSSAVFGGSYTPSASTTSGLQVTFSTSGPISISANVVSYTGAGTGTVYANQAGDVNYNAALQVSHSFVIGQASQTISFASNPPPGATVGGSYVLSASATSGSPVAFSSGSPSTVSLTGNFASFIGVGTGIVLANQAGNANYLPAVPVTQSFTISGGGGGRLRADADSDEHPLVLTEMAEPINIYPNPADQTLTIMLDQPATSAIPLLLFNITGVAMLNNQLDAGQQTKTISIREMISGTYILHVKKDNGVVRKKVIVLH